MTQEYRAARRNDAPNGSREVLLANTAGFCMGVSLALRRLDRMIEEQADVIGGNAGLAAAAPLADGMPPSAVTSPADGAPPAGGVSPTPPRGRLLMLGPVIHNPQVLADYAQRGVICVNSVDEVTTGDRVVIRAHGLPCHEEAALCAKGALVVDATCPKVKKAQLAIRKATANGAPLLLFGESEHPEVRGLVSYAQGSCRIFSSLEELFALPLPPSFVVAAQTTQDEALFQEAVSLLYGKGHKIRVLATICHATSKRQQEAVRLAGLVDFFVVLGGHASGNTRRLADVAGAGGVPALLVENLDELAAAFAQNPQLRAARRIGLTAGASTPKKQVDAALLFMKSIAH